MYLFLLFFFFSSRRRHTRSLRDWSSDVCSSDLVPFAGWDMPLRYGSVLDEHRACRTGAVVFDVRSEEHTSELQSRRDLVCRLLLEKKKKKKKKKMYTNTVRRKSYRFLVKQYNSV